MSTARQKWESIYADDKPEPAPSDLLLRWASRLEGRVLDLACGSARNGLYLARCGHAVDLIDIAMAPLRRATERARNDGLIVRAVQADLDNFPLPRATYDVLLNFRFLQRSLWQPIKAALRPHGIIIFETYTIEQEKIGHPRNPLFLLRPGELGDEFAAWNILHYHEGLDAQSGAHVAQLVAQHP